MAVKQMCVDDARRFHQRVHRGGADKRVASLAQCLAERNGCIGGCRNLRDGTRLGRRARPERPDEIRKPAIRAQRDGCGRVADRRQKLRAIAEAEAVGQAPGLD